MKKETIAKLAGLVAIIALANIDPILNRITGKSGDYCIRGLNDVYFTARVVHKDVKKLYLEDSKKDFDKDGKTDPYVECNDGAIFSRLSSRNGDYMPMGDFWFKVDEEK